MSSSYLSATSASLPSTLEFAKVEDEICVKWATEQTFATQDRLSQERGDKVL